ncbi:transcription initiation factor TFIID subunit 3-like isoform X2 [Homarus americanus]|uniref:transcription initiation factor TFIID subunit 3-like isoform X2 n=1 Tax=Homarus americanus TaxID=6706 RepID=UPI001C44CDAA|nr:transcription initiation factor TFIID subunit 3-like isoform X2 [Homarus americanus]
MASQFRNEILKTSVGQICQAIGFHGIYSTPLDVLCDLLHRYMTEVCRLTHRYTEHFGRTEPNLDDLGLAFLDMGISVSELEEYINNVDCPPFPNLLSALPVPRTSNLNFLKPGSREILSRPIHIHEHLPPMYPEKEEEELDVKVNSTLDEAMGEGSSPTLSPQPAVKRSSDSDTSPAKKSKYSLDDEGQPVREIVSVMMTTSGFISSAREGKLPEARCPNIPMATPRSSSPSASGAAGKKKLTVEKLIRQKNNQGGSGRSMPNKPPRPLKVKVKDKSGSKGLKIPKVPLPRPPLHSQTGNANTPGASPIPPKLKMPTPKVSMPKTPNPKPPFPKIPTSKASTPKSTPPKVSTPKNPNPKTSTPKIKVPKPPKTPKSETKKPSTPKSKDPGKEGEPKKVKKEKEPGKKTKESKKEKDPTKKTKENKKDKDGKKEKESKKEKEIKKEKENKKEKEREQALIMALASSSAVTVTSIPAPSKTQEVSVQDKAEGKSKLSIFKRINKGTKDNKEQDRPGERDAQQSRDSSPDLMIDENPARLGQRRLPEELTVIENPSRRFDTSMDDMVRSPGDFSVYQDDMSPPGTPSTPRTPEIPYIPIRKPSEKRKGKEKTKEKRPRKDRSKSPKCGFSPGHREPCDFETPERPKTPEVGLPPEDLGGPSTAPFSIPPFSTAPGFIPPFSRFPFIPPFSGPPPRLGLPHPPIPDLRLPPHTFLPRPPSKRPLEDDHLSPLDDPENLERPLTPRHARDSSPLPVTSHPSPLRSPSPNQMSATPPRPRTPAHHSPPPMPRIKVEKVDKTDKEKKKEHKKEKKEKEKEKDKIKKKKDKKDKEKEKDKSDKKKEKEKTKLEKKEKKVKKEKDDGANVPRITMKLSSTSSSSPPRPSAPRPVDTTPTPKLVIKPVVKREEDMPPTKPTSVPSGTHDDQPGSPEIAKFSALITRPPRSQQKKGESPPVVPVLKIKDFQNPVSKQKEGKDTSHSQTKAKDTKEVPPLKIKTPSTTTTKTPAMPKLPSVTKPPSTPKQPSTPKLPTTPKPLSVPKPPPMTKLAEDKKSPGSKKIREKKEKKEKKPKDQAPPPTPTPAAPSLSIPATSSAGGTDQSFPSQPVPTSVPIVSPPPDTPKTSKKQEQKGTGLLTETVGPIGHFVDDQGNEVWICPTCGKQDDGSPMIGCDTCDDWYHWVCVGIQVPPNDDVNWYCPRCLSQHKQRGAPPEKKKRGRKKK